MSSETDIGECCPYCGSRYFVWWVEDRSIYSSPTDREDYRAESHPDARCYGCNRRLEQEQNG